MIFRHCISHKVGACGALKRYVCRHGMTQCYQTESHEGSRPPASNERARILLHLVEPNVTLDVSKHPTCMACKPKCLMWNML